MITKEESDRLEALRKLNILDTPSNANIDDLVHLVADLCGVPIVAVSLVDENRQWFKSSKGLSVCETPRNIAFCDHAIKSKEPFVIPDASLDTRFSENPLVLNSPFIRFYAGIPLVFRSGFIGGTLCIIDSKPRDLDPFHLRAISVIAKQITEHLEREDRERHREELETLLENHRLTIAATSKMSALGEMAAGIAHEINSPLGAVLSRAGILIEKSEKGPLDPQFVREYAQAIETTGLRISKTVRALRAFARDGENDNVEITSIQTLLDDTLELCKERFKEGGVKLILHISELGLNVQCRSTEITQVLLNLLNNAYDAIAETFEPWVELSCKRTPKGIEFSVRNSGPPIPEEIRSRLMQPFFTTKPVGKGTGLGLSISQRILHSHNSSLELDKECKETRFHFVLDEYQDIHTESIDFQKAQ